MATISEITAAIETESDPAALASYARHRSFRVRCAVAHNPHTSTTTIAKLLVDPHEIVRLSAAGPAADHPSTHEIVMNADDKWMRAVMADAFRWRDEDSLPHDVERRLALDDFVETRGRVAASTKYGDIFEGLMVDSHPHVRGWCAANRHITREQMERLVTDRHRLVRAMTAAVGLRFPDDEQLMRLAGDKSADVRWSVLRRVGRPRAAVEAMCSDPDDIVRHHAQLDYADEHGIMSAEYIAQIQDGRTRADTGAVFEWPPGGTAPEGRAD